MALGYDYSYILESENVLDLNMKDISSISRRSFKSPISIFFSCNTATNNEDGKNFAQKWSKRFNSPTIAFEGSTYYGGLRSGSLWEKVFVWGIRPSTYYPRPGQGARGRVYPEDYFKKKYPLFFR